MGVNGGSKQSKKFQGKCNNCGAKGHKEADCWQKEENAHKRPKNWKQRNLQREVNASSIEQLLICIDCENSPVFELCGGLVDDWRNEVNGLAEDSLNSKSNDHKTKELEAANNLIDTFEGLSTAEDKCIDSKLKPKKNRESKNQSWSQNHQYHCKLSGTETNARGV
mmetsp:Transcript_6852/g.13712  ORF Transcript_6852/g.13712 Transcript_6852/m.13712 type:complete len:166 (-) Transcript_6852:717-1214(-)